MNIYCSTTQSLLVEPEDAVNKELIVKLYMSFQLYRESVPQTPMLFRDQQYCQFHLTFLFISFSEQNLRDKNWGIISQAATDEGEFLPRFCVVSHKIRDIV